MNKKFKQPRIEVPRLKRALRNFHHALGKRKTLTGPQALAIFVRSMNEVSC